MDFIWIRHGEKLFSNGRAPRGSTHSPLDPPLVPGEVDRLSTAPWPEVGPTDAVYTSPFLRARETADALFGPGVATIDARISEFLGHQTRFASRGLAECVSRETYAGLSKTEADIAPGSETPRRLRVRAGAFFRDAARAAADSGAERVFVVSHGFVIQSALASIGIRDAVVAPGEAVATRVRFETTGVLCAE